MKQHCHIVASENYYTYEEACARFKAMDAVMLSTVIVPDDVNNTRRLFYLGHKFDGLLVILSGYETKEDLGECGQNGN